MDSSDRDEPMEPPIRDPDDAGEVSPVEQIIHEIEADEGQNPGARDVDLSEEEGFPPPTPSEDLHTEFTYAKAEQPFQHTPESIYIYDGTEPTMHQVLGLIEPGGNQWPTDEAMMVAALEACCASGLLRQVVPAPEPQRQLPDEPPEDARA